MSIRKSPFYYGGVVKDEYFCNRSKETKELVTDIDSGLNVLLYAPRRFGKTSLVLNALSKTKYAYIFLDLMSIVDTEEFINEYFNAISKGINTPSDKVVTDMKSLFFDKNKPFYKSVKHVPIDKIDSSDWEEYIKHGFESHGKQIPEECIAAILEVSKGFPYYSQQIAYELFHMSDIHVETPMVQVAVDSILEKEEDLFWNEWNHLSQNQKKALKLLIYAEGENIYSKATMEQFHFTSSSLKKAIEGVLAKDMVDQKAGKYYFQDPLFEYWLSQQ